MTHIAWVPEEWVEAAEDVLAGLAERHPSRTIVLVPRAGRRGRARRRASRSTASRAGERQQVCTETIRLRLGGERAPRRPASVVAAAADARPAGLPALARAAAVRRAAFEQLVDVVDRLIVDSTEWPGLPRAYARLAEIFDRVAVSDIAWARTSRWRPQLASLWPGIADVERIRVTGTDGAGAPARGLAALAARARDRARARAGRPARRRRARRRAGAVPARRPARPGRRASRRARALHPRPRLRGGGEGSGLRRRYF